MAELSTLARPYAKAAFEFAVDARIFKVGPIALLLRQLLLSSARLLSY